MFMNTSLLIGFYFIAPFLLMILVPRFKFLYTIGVIVLCYGIGLLAGNLGLADVSFHKIQNQILNIVVPLSLPLIFFSMDISRFRYLAKPASYSFFVGLFSVVSSVILAYLLFPRAAYEETWKIAGMAIGVYTGGTPNLAAIGSALKTDQSVYVAVHTADVAVGAVYLFFLMSVAHKFFSLFLPKFNREGILISEEENQFTEDFKGFRKSHILPVLIAALLSILIVAIAALIGFQFKSEIQSIVIILIITTLSVLLSFVKKIRSIKYSYQMGFYLLSVFSLAVSSMADLTKILDATPKIFLFITFVYISSSLLHAIFSWILKIDVDTYLITSVSFLYSPPFVPVIASQFKNPHIILTGILTGIIGWIVGNYLGISIALMIQSFAQ